ncbi:unnamed protein product, partial [Ectocarpus sp. 4 AP-2014]
SSTAFDRTSLSTYWTRAALSFLSSDLLTSCADVDATISCLAVKMETDTDNEGSGASSARDAGMQEDKNGKKSSCRNTKAKARWWCSSGTRCEDHGGLKFHRHPFENDLEKCHDFVLETGMELRLAHASRKEADKETRRVLNAQKAKNHLASEIARGGDERRAGAGGGSSFNWNDGSINRRNCYGSQG